MACSAQFQEGTTGTSSPKTGEFHWSCHFRQQLRIISERNACNQNKTVITHSLFFVSLHMFDVRRNRTKDTKINRHIGYHRYCTKQVINNTSQELFTVDLQSSNIHTMQPKDDKEKYSSYCLGNREARRNKLPANLN